MGPRIPERRPAQGSLSDASGPCQFARRTAGSISVRQMNGHTLRCARTTSSVSSPIAPAATRRPLERMQNSLGHAARERQFLFDQEHGQPLFAVQLQDNIADFVNDIRLNSFGGLVENQQLRFEHERSADRELLLLPAGKIAAAPVQHLASARGTDRRCGLESRARRSCARRGPRAGSPPPSDAKKSRVPAAHSRCRFWLALRRGA